MKNLLHLRKCILFTGVCLAATLCPNSGQAQTPRPFTNMVVSTFDDFLSPSIVTGIGGGLGGSSTYDWDTENAGGGAAGSGSLIVTIPWNNTSGGWQEVQVNFGDPIGGWPGVPMAPFYTIEYDVKVKSGDLGTDGSYGNVQAILQGWNGAGLNNGDGWRPLGLQAITSTDWQHVTHFLTSVSHMNLNQLVINFVGQNVTNACEYLVDNLEVKVPTGPPPTLSLETPPTPGLHLVQGSGYARENIRTVGTNYAWVGASEPVSYSLTIKEYPNQSVYSNFSCHIFLVPNESSSPPNSDPDWAEPTLVRVDFETVNGITNAGWANPNTKATATFRYKTNAPNSNGYFYPDDGSPNIIENGSIGFLPVSTSILGTWTVTFNSDTDVTLTAPDGSSTNFAFADAVGNFPADSLRVFYGVAAPSDTSEEGQECILSSVAITGTGGGLSDDFTGVSLDTSKWQVAAANPNNVFQVAPGPAYTLGWPVPDNLFVLYSATNLAEQHPWQVAGLSTSLSSGIRSAVVPEGVPGEREGYFNLIQRVPTKLQILLPGEAPAPGTIAGKTGTPNEQNAGVPFQIVVNAVDDNWYPAYSADEIWLASDAGDNFGYVWAEELLQGTYTYTVTNLSAGTWTITTGDNTDTNIVSDTSSSYTVNP